MNVFDILQPRFFNLLASNSNARLHSDCLLQIYHVYDQEIAFKLDRNSVRDAIAVYLMDVSPQEDGEETYASPNEYANAIIRACSVSQRVRIFEHNFAEAKEKIRRNTDVLQGFLTQDSAKFAEKTCAGRY